MRNGGGRGSILIMTVWSLSFLSVLAAGLGARGIGMLSLTQRLQQQLEARYAAHAGVQRMRELLEADPTAAIDGPTEAWLRPSAALTGAEGAATFAIEGVVDEDRKLNLNTVPAAVWSRLFQAAGGLREPEATALGEAIEDWRDEDQETRKNGAEDFYYRGLSPAYEAKDGLVESPEELLFVRGMTPGLFARVRPWITAYGSGRVNLNTAEDLVLQALGFSEAGAFGLLAYRAGEDGALGTEDDRTLISAGAAAVELAPYLSTADAHHLQSLVQQELVGVGAEALAFVVAARTEVAHSEVALACVLDRKGAVLSWSER